VADSVGSSRLSSGPPVTPARSICVKSRRIGASTADASSAPTAGASDCGGEDAVLAWTAGSGGSAPEVCARPCGRRRHSAAV
jgi:hypothetical protein